MGKLDGVSIEVVKVKDKLVDGKLDKWGSRWECDEDEVEGE